MILREGEELEVLVDDIKIIQHMNRYKFSVDSVLLADFIKAFPGEKIVDLGTGAGVLPLMITAKISGLKIVGVEIQEDLADMAGRSVRYNKKSENVFILKEDLNDAPDILGNDWDVVISNPPYFTIDEGRINPNIFLAIARHEIKCTLEQVICTAEKLLKAEGRFYMVHRYQRMEEIVNLCCLCGLYPAELQPVASSADKEPYLILIECIKSSACKLKKKPVKILADCTKVSERDFAYE